MPSPFKLSPSDLTFLWDECPRCFYLKVVRGINRPAAPFPRIFSRIDLLMKGYFQEKASAEISPKLPPGKVRFGERWVQSTPIVLPKQDASAYLKGKFDTVVEFADGSFGVVDFKTSEAKAEHVAFYSRQLHAYAYALEHPSANAFALAPISRLGLLCVEPVAMELLASGQLAYCGSVTWLEIPLDMAGFQAFIESILTVLALPLPPAPAEKCAYCRYRQESRTHSE